MATITRAVLLTFICGLFIVQLASSAPRHEDFTSNEEYQTVQNQNQENNDAIARRLAINNLKQAQATRRTNTRKCDLPALLAKLKNSVNTQSVTPVISSPVGQQHENLPEILTDISNILKGDVIASNLGSGVNNVQDSTINVDKNEQSGGDFIASNLGSGVNNVQDSDINVISGHDSSNGYGWTSNSQYGGDIVASNLGSGVNNVKDSSINVLKNGQGSGDFIASNLGSGVNNVEDSQINVLKGSGKGSQYSSYEDNNWSHQNSYGPQYYGDYMPSNVYKHHNGERIVNQPHTYNNIIYSPGYWNPTLNVRGHTYAPFYHGDIIASNIGSGTNSVKDSTINVAKQGYGPGSFIASNAGSGVNSVENSQINVLHHDADSSEYTSNYFTTRTPQIYSEVNSPRGTISVVPNKMGTQSGDIIASNTGTGVNNVKDSDILVVKDQQGGNIIASNTGSGINNVEGSNISVLGAQPVTVYENLGTANVDGHRVPVMKAEHGDIIASNLGSGVNNVKDSNIVVVKDSAEGPGDFIASNAGSGVNNVEGTNINVLKGYGYTQQPSYGTNSYTQSAQNPHINSNQHYWQHRPTSQSNRPRGTISVIPNKMGTQSGDIIASNTGTGVNNVEDSDILVIKDQQGGNTIASNTGSGTNNVQGSKITVGGNQNQHGSYAHKPATIFENMGTAYVDGHKVPVFKESHGDVIASNLGSGINNVKDSNINVIKNSHEGTGDFIASNAGSGVNNVEGTNINVVKESDGTQEPLFIQSSGSPNSYMPQNSWSPNYHQGDVIASNLGSGVNSVKDSDINVIKNGHSGTGDFIASNAGSGVNNVEGTNINVVKGSDGSQEPLFIQSSGSPNSYMPQNSWSPNSHQGDVIASNLGSGVNSVKDSDINVIKNGHSGTGDFIASNAGSGVNNVERTNINVLKEHGYTQRPSYDSNSYSQYAPNSNTNSANQHSWQHRPTSQANRPRGTISVIPNKLGTQSGDIIASNTGTGVNNVEDSDILVVKDQQGGNTIASNTGSGTNNVQGSKITVVGNQNQHENYAHRPATIFESMGTAYVDGHKVPVFKESHGDVIASNLGSGVNNVKDSNINVIKNGHEGSGDFIASNAGSGVNNVEGTNINVVKGPGGAQEPLFVHSSGPANTHMPQNSWSPNYHQGDVIASNLGSGVNSVKDSNINVVKNGHSGQGDFIASNAGSGVNNVEGTNINILKGQGYTQRPSYDSNSYSQYAPNSNTNSANQHSWQHRPISQSNRPRGTISVIPNKMGTQSGDIIASNTGTGINNVEDSDILVVKDQQGGNTIASNTGSGTNNVQGSKITVVGNQNQHGNYAHRPATIFESMGTAYVDGHKVPVFKESHGDVIASNLGSGVNNVKDSNINVIKNGHEGSGDFVASNAGSGVNNVEGTNINVVKRPGGAQEPLFVHSSGPANTHMPQNSWSPNSHQGDVIASNLGSGVNSVKDSNINIVKNGHSGQGDFIASNAGSGVNNVEGTNINVFKGQGYTQRPSYDSNSYSQYAPNSNTNSANQHTWQHRPISQSNRPRGTISVIPNKMGTQSGDIIASNTGTGINNVEDSDILVVKDQQGGNTIASNTGSGTNNVQGSKITVVGNQNQHGNYAHRPATIFESMGTAYVDGHKVPVFKESHGDVIASNLGSGVNNVKDSNINVIKNGHEGSGDFIASNAGSGVNNVEGTNINVVKGPGGAQEPLFVHSSGPANTHMPQNSWSPNYHQGDVIASNLGSGVNSVKDSNINVVKNGHSGQGDFIASNAGSGVNNVEGTNINVLKGQGFTQRPSYDSNSYSQYAPNSNTNSANQHSWQHRPISQSNRPRGTISVIPNKMGTQSGDIIASNTGTGINNVEDSDILVVKDQQGGNTIASNTGSGTNNVQGSKITVAGNQNQHENYAKRPVTIFENMGTTNVNGHRVPVMKEEHGDIIASNLGSGVNNVKDSNIVVVKDKSDGPGDFIASNAGSGVNNVDGTNINVLKGQGYTQRPSYDSKSYSQYAPNSNTNSANQNSWQHKQTSQSNRPRGTISVIPNKLGTQSGDIIASNTGTGVNNVEDSDILVVKDQQGGNTIASNTGSGTNNVQGSKITVVGNQNQHGSYAHRPATIFESMGTAYVDGHKVPIFKESHGDVIASNLGSGVNNVKDSNINVIKNGHEGTGDFIASNAGSGVNNVEGTNINVIKGLGGSQEPMFVHSSGPSNTYESQNPWSPYYHQGDVIASNLGSGVNSVKDSNINVVKNAHSGQGDFIASNLGSGVNNVENTEINVLKNQGTYKQHPSLHHVAANTGAVQIQQNQWSPSYTNSAQNKGRISVIPNKFGTQSGDVIGSNTGSGVNNVQNSDILVVKDQQGGNTIASNTGSGVNNVEGSKISVFGGQQSGFTSRPVNVLEQIGTANVDGHQIPVMKAEHGDIIASNLGSGVNNVKDSNILVVKDNADGPGDFIASNAGAGVNNVEGTNINVLKGHGFNQHGNQQSDYNNNHMPVTVLQNVGTTNINGHNVPVVKQSQGDIIASNLGSGINNVKDSNIVIMKENSNGGNIIASNAGSGVNNVEGSNINVISGYNGGNQDASQYYEDEDDVVCDDLQDSDMSNVKDILKQILFGEKTDSTESMDKISDVLNQVQNFDQLRDILNQLLPNEDWNISNKQLNSKIIQVLSHPDNTPFSDLINGLFNYKLAGGDGDLNALYHLIGFTTPEAERQFDLEHILNTIYPESQISVENYDSDIIGNQVYNSLDTDSTSITNMANEFGHVNTLNSPDVAITNVADANGHINTLNTADVEITNLNDNNGHVNTLNTDQTSIVNADNGHETSNALSTYNSNIKNHNTDLMVSHDAPGCEFFQYLKAKFPTINEKFIEKAVLNTVSNYITHHQLYDQWHDGRKELTYEEKSRK